MHKRIDAFLNQTQNWIVSLLSLINTVNVSLVIPVIFSAYSSWCINWFEITRIQCSFVVSYSCAINFDSHNSRMHKIVYSNRISHILVIIGAMIHMAMNVKCEYLPNVRYSIINYFIYCLDRLPYAMVTIVSTKSIPHSNPDNMWHILYSTMISIITIEKKNISDCFRI